MLDRQYQAMTIDPNRLLIGIASVQINGEDLGAIKESGIEITSETKDRYIGYPAQRHQTETVGVTAIATVTAEEIGGAPLVSLLTNLFDNIANQNAITYDMAMFAPYAGGGNLRLSSTTQMLPEISLDFQDEWCNLTFKFECIGATPTALMTRSTVDGARLPATTINTMNLSIGKPKMYITGSSIGSVQSVQVALIGQIKKVEKGYPKCTEKIIYLESKFEINVTAEEQILAISNDFEVVIEQAIVDGGALRLTFPHCKVQQDLSVKPVNDWLGIRQKIIPFKVEDDNRNIVLFERIPA